MSRSFDIHDCPQCCEPTETQREGYCEACRMENQAQLDIHNAQADYWNSLSDQCRADAVLKAMRFEI